MRARWYSDRTFDLTVGTDRWGQPRSREKRDPGNEAVDELGRSLHLLYCLDKKLNIEINAYR